MATRTLVLRPSADTNLNHARSSGSNGYSLIDDETADDNSSYIYHTLSNTSDTTITSAFVFGGNIPIRKISVSAVRLYVRASRGNNGETASYNCYFAVGTDQGGSSDSAKVSATLTSSYVTTNSASSSMITQINNALANGSFPTISVKVQTTGHKSDEKWSNNGYARITQIYIEIDYEYADGKTDALYTKDNGSWVMVAKAYKKVNGTWVEQSDLTTVFQSGTNYVKGN